MIELGWEVFEAGYCKHPEFSTRCGGTWKALQFPALVSLIRHPQEGLILFDTGYSRHFYEATRRVPERLYRLVTPVTLSAGQSVAEQLQGRGIDQGAITKIFISHFHGDHVGGLPDYSHAQLFCSQTAWQDLHNRSRLSAIRSGLLKALAPTTIASRCCFLEKLRSVKLPSAFRPLEQGVDLLGDGSLLAVSLPGHGVGHHGLCFFSGNRYVFLVGDAAWSSAAIRLRQPPPRWAANWLGDVEAYETTFKALHTISVSNPEILLVPSHCREFRP